MKEPLRLAVAGLGTVGSGTVRLLRAHEKEIAAKAGRPVKLVAVCARDRRKNRNLTWGSAEWVRDALSLAARPDIDVVVELIGGTEGIARDLCAAALANGKAVVTANKALLAAHGYDLARLAEKNKAPLMFEAAVCGGLPIIKTLREALAANEIASVRGILNGTCNYILTRMARENLSFGAALAEAQRLGYAEAEPSADVDGHDSAHKLAILSSLAFGVKPDLKAVTVEGIRTITPMDFRFAEELGCRIKLLGMASRTPQGIAQGIAPCLVPVGSPLSAVDEVMNAVQIQGDAVGPLTLMGRGAGSEATASAVLGDIVDLARGVSVKPWGVPLAELSKGRFIKPGERVSRWYIRLHVTDKAGVLASIASIFRDESISIETLIQHGRSTDKAVPLIAVTHPVREAALKRALGRIGRLKTVWEEPFCLRIQSETAVS